MAEIRIETIFDSKLAKSQYEAFVKSIESHKIRLNGQFDFSDFAKVTGEVSKFTKELETFSAVDFREHVNGNVITSVQKLKNAVGDVLTITRKTTKGIKGDTEEWSYDYHKNINAMKKGLDNYQQSLNQTSQTQESYNKTAKQTSQTQETLNKTTGETTSAFGELAKKISGLGSTMIINLALSSTISAFKDAISTMKDVDSELVSIQKVLGATDSEMQQLSDTAYECAANYGRTATEYLEMATTFARAGFDTQIEELSELGLLLQNVGDISADLSSKFMIAANAAWELNGNTYELGKIIDGMNAITNSAAVDMEAMTEGMTVAASAFSAAGESAQTFSALLGTGVAATQRSGSEVARALRTIAMNVRQIKGELDDGTIIDEESISDAAKALSTVGVSVADVNGNLRLTSDVLDDLASKWNTLNTNQKSQITEELAGKRQANILSALMNNWEQYSQMIDIYTNSIGSAFRENKYYLNSWEAKTSQLSSTWTDFVQQTISSNTIKSLIGDLTSIIKLIGDLGTALTIITAFTAKKTLTKLTEDFLKVSKASENTTKTITSFASSLGTVATVAFAVISVFNLIMNAIDAVRDKTISAGEESVTEAKYIYELKNAYEEAKTQYKNGTLSKEAYITATENLADALGIEKSSIDDVQKSLSELSIEELKRALSDANAAVEAAFANINSISNNGVMTHGYIEASLAQFGLLITPDDTDIQALEKYKELLSKLRDERDRLISNKGDFTNSTYKGLLNRYNSEITALTDNINAYESAVSNADDAQVMLNGAFGDGEEELSKSSERQKAYHEFVTSSIRYTNELNEAKREGANLDKTIYGNVDLNNRNVLNWTAENINKNKEALQSWRDDLKTYKELYDEFIGTYSTIDASSMEFDGIEIAFTPMLQTPDGVEYLSKETVVKYIQKLISELGDNWNSEDLLALDSKGVSVNGKKIKNIIADIGDTARATAKQMHYIGKDGSVNDAYKDYIKAQEEYNSVSEETLDACEDTESALDDVAEAYDEVAEATKNATNALDEYNSEMELTNYGDSFKQYAEAYAKGLEAWNKGLKGSNEVKSLIDLMLPDSFVNEMQGDWEKMGELVFSSFMQGIMSEDGSDFGSKLQAYMYNNLADASGELRTANGELAATFEKVDDSIVGNIQDLGLLSKAIKEQTGIELDEGFLEAWLDATQIFSPEVHKSVEQVKALQEELGILNATAGEGSRVFVNMKNTIKAMIDSGNYSMADIWDWANALLELKNNGQIILDVSSTGDVQTIINDIQNEVNNNPVEVPTEVEDETTEVKVSYTVENIEEAHETDEVLSSIKNKKSLKPKVSISVSGLSALNSVLSALEKIQSYGAAVPNVTTSYGYTATPTKTGIRYTKTGKSSTLSEASGTDSFTGGLSLVNEEGPEIIRYGNSAWISGNGEPTLTEIPVGAQIYTAEETKKILNKYGPEVLYGGTGSYATGKYSTTGEANAAERAAAKAKASGKSSAEQDAAANRAASTVKANQEELAAAKATYSGYGKSSGNGGGKINKTLTDDDDTTSGGSGGGSSSSSSSTTDAQLEKLQKAVKLRESELSLIEAQKGSVSAQVEKQQQIQSALMEQIKYMESIGSDQDEINALYTQYYNINQEIIDLKQGELADVVKLRQSELDLIQAQKGSTDSQVEKLGQIQEALLKEIQYMETVSADQDAINDLYTEYYNINQDIISLKQQELADNVALKESELSLIEAQNGSVSSQVEKQKEIQDSLMQQIQYMESVGADQSDINDLYAQYYNIGKNIDDLRKEEFSDIVDLKESELSLIQAQNGSADVQIAKQKEIQEALLAQIAYLESIGADQGEINALYSQYYNISKDINELKKTEIEDSKTLRESELNLIRVQNGTVDEQVSKLNQIQDVLFEEIQYLESIGAEQSEINNLYTEYYNLNQDIIDLKAEELASSVSLRKSELNLIEAQKGSTDTQINKQKEIQSALMNEIKYLESIGSEQEKVNSLYSEYYNINQNIEKLQLDELKDVVSLRESELSLIETQGGSVDSQIAKQRQIQEALLTQVEYLKSIGAEQSEINALYNQYYQINQDVLDIQRQTYEDIISLRESELSLIEAQDATTDSQISKQKEIQSAITDEINYLKSIGAEQEEINSLSAKYYNISEDIENLRLNDLKEVVSLRESELDLIETQGGTTDSQIAKQKQIQEALLSQIDYLKSIGAEQSEINGLYSQYYQINEDIENLRLNDYKEAVSLRESELSLIESQGGSVKEQIAQQRKVQSALMDEINYLKSIGAEQNEINDLYSQYYDINEKVAALQQEMVDDLYDAMKRQVEDNINALEEERDSRVQAIQDQIDALKKARDIESEELELNEKILAVQKAQANLSNAQKERTVRYFNALTGQWEWGANANDIKSATEALNDAEDALKNYEEEQAFNSKISQLEDEQDAIEKQFQSQIDAWETFASTLEEPLESIQDIISRIEANATSDILPAIREANEKLSELGYQISIAGLDSTSSNTSSNSGVSDVVANAVEQVITSNGTDTVLSSDMTNKIFGQTYSSPTTQKMGDLGYLFGSNTAKYGGYGNTIGSQHNGDIYQLGEIKLTSEQAKVTTIADLARMSRNLRVYSSN